MTKDSRATDELLLEQYSGAQPPDTDQDDSKLAREKAYANYQLLWENRRWLGKVLLYGIIFSILVAFLLPTEYESTAELMPPGQSGGSTLGVLSALAGGGAGRALAGLGSMLGGAKTTGDLYVGVLSSRTVEDDLVDKFDLRRVYGKRRQEDARKKLDSRTDLSVDKKSEIIKIAVTDRDPKRAAAMTQEYVEELNRLMTELDTGESHRERVFLEIRLAQVKQDLERAENTFSQFASKNVAVDVPEQSKTMLATSSQLEGQLIATETELQGLRQIYTDTNVRVRTTQARVDEIERQLQLMRGNNAGLDSSGDGSSSLPYPSVRKLSSLEVEYADLLRNTKVQEAVFEALTQQYESAKVDEAKNLPIARVLDRPEVPEKKSFPPRAVITIVGALSFLGLGMLWLIRAEDWRKIDPQDPRKVFLSKIGTDLKKSAPQISGNHVTPSKRGADISGTDNGHDRLNGPKKKSES